MIISRTPLRISLFGGGTDFKSFYSKFNGSVLGFTINKYVYININYKFEPGYRIAYSKVENVHKVSEIKHPLVRNCLTKLAIKVPLEITSIADVPSKGSGLGSSSAFTVGLLRALQVLTKEKLKVEDIARLACEVEINLSGEPIGKQDQYFASYGGLNFINFKKNEKVTVNKISLQEESSKEFFNSFILFYTGKSRKSNSILVQQSRNIEENYMLLDNMKLVKQQAILGRELMMQDKFDEIGYLLHEAWRAKKRFHSYVTTPEIDTNYSIAQKYGAYGGKILGAGGGGFMLFYVPRKFQKKLILRLPDWKPVAFNFEPNGTKIMNFGA
jgi:D-glycero-alpha-D-manno-heptose-7-phosphate kinase